VDELSACFLEGIMCLSGPPACCEWPWVRIPVLIWVQMFVWLHPDLFFLTHGTGSSWLQGRDSEQQSFPPSVRRGPAWNLGHQLGRKWCDFMRSWILAQVLKDERHCWVLVLTGSKVSEDRGVFCLRIL
jgi:hypothetical protein